MVHSVVGNGGGVVHGGSMVDCVVGKRGSVVDSVVGHRGGVNCMVDRGVGNGATCEGCEGNLGISLGLGGSQDSGEEGSNGECLHDVALLEDRDRMIRGASTRVTTRT